LDNKQCNELRRSSQCASVAQAECCHFVIALNEPTVHQNAFISQLGLAASLSRLTKHSMWASLRGCIRTDGRWALVIGFPQITQMVFLLRVSFRIEGRQTRF
jgi:hypothetical protein